MALADTITTEMKNAMKAKDTKRLETLRAIRGEILILEKKSTDASVTDDDVVAVIKRLVKQRLDSIEKFKEGNRDDLVENEESQLAILKEFLPEGLGEDEIGSLVSEAISESGASGPADMGKVMKLMMEKIKATGKDADNKLVSSLVKSKLSG